MHTHTQSEWNPPEGSFGTALLNLSPAGKQSVGSKRKPVGASSHPTLPSPRFSFSSCTLSCSHLLYLSILLSSSPSFFIVSTFPQLRLSSVSLNPPPPRLDLAVPPTAPHPTLSSLVIISFSPEDGPGRFHPQIHLSVICWGVASHFSRSSSLSNRSSFCQSVFSPLPAFPSLPSIYPVLKERG